MTTCTVQVLHGALYEECGAEVGADGVCAAGHGDDQALAKAAEHHRAAPEMNLTPGTWPVTRKFFSVDDHIVEPADVWSKRVPAKFRDAAPHVVEADGREYWEYEGERALTMGLNAVAGKPRDQWTMEPTRFTDMIPGCYDPVARARDMVSDGITASVCFPTLPRFGGVLFNSFKDKELAERLRAGVERLHPRRMVRGRARPVRAHADLPDLGPRCGGGGDPAHGWPRRPRALLPGGDELPRSPLLLQRLLGSRVGRGHRGRHPGVHAHRLVGQQRVPTTRRAVLAHDRARVRGRRAELGRPHDEPGAAQVPDGEVRDVRGWHRVGTGGVGACRPPGRPAPVLVG